jgi:hypothetical protein
MSTQNRSRRMVLRGLFATGCALCLSRLSLVQAGKMSKDQAQYQELPKDDQKCSNCIHFMAPNACMIVEGNISPTGWCKLWVKKPS